MFGANMNKSISAVLFSVFFALALTITASAQKSIAGEWDATFNTPGGPQPLTLLFKVDGEKITGTAKRSRGDVPISGTIKGDDISFAYSIDYNGNPVTITFTGKVKGDTMGGSVSFNDTAGDDWSAKRAAPAKP
jgi:hypothetical protein